MKKKDIVKKTSAMLGFEEADISAVISVVVREVSESLSSGENVYLRGLGTFSVVEVKERLRQNLAEGKQIVIPAHKKVKFTPSLKIKGSLRKIKN